MTDPVPAKPIETSNPLAGPIPLVIKLGGRALEDISKLHSLFNRIAVLQTERPCVLVHGGGSLVDQWLHLLQRPVQKEQGLRITSAENMPFVAGALAGNLNTQLVAALNHHTVEPAKLAKIRAVGVSLADADWCQLKHDTARGQVGTPDLSGCEASYLKLLLIAGLLPVVCSIGAFNNGTLANVNADLAAAAVAALLQAELLLLTDVDAIYDTQGDLIAEITPTQGADLISNGTVQGGMRVKLEAALQAAQMSRRSTAVAAWYNDAALTALLNGQAPATRINL